MPTRFTILVATCVLLAGAAPHAASAQAPVHQHYAKPDEAAKQPSPTGALAPRLQNVGPHVFPVTTSNERAQLFVSQGVNLAYGFNHPEAGRAFAEAARLDPDCAMAYWGQALVIGPNINAPMDPADEARARQFIELAIAKKGGASQRERDWFDALAARYTGNAADRAAADRAYAQAMRALAAKYPDDLDAATMFAESLMDLRPWNYWTRDGLPYDGTADAAAALQSVIERDPNHIGALHYWIHLMEATDPGAAEAAADRLMPLAPSAGHLVHMPGHIFIRVGRYSDAVRANELAIAADEDYITQCRVQSIYPLAYYPHNLHFLWASATFDGRSQLAIETANKMAAKIDLAQIQQFPFLQQFLVPRYFALVRFGKWDEMLREPRPAYDSLMTRGVWHYARGIAFAGKGQADAADKELRELSRIVADPELARLSVSSYNSTVDILRIAELTLAGEIAARRRDFNEAIARLDTAVRFYDLLVYTEPEDWHYPVRQSLGAVLLEAGRAPEAEIIYWQDLREHPENGWSLFGLARALRAQKKDSEADLVEKRFAKAWARADVTLTSSRF